MCSINSWNENLRWTDAVILELFFFQGGITEEQMLKFMGANTHLTPMQAKTLLEVSLSRPPPHPAYVREQVHT